MYPKNQVYSKNKNYSTFHEGHQQLGSQFPTTIKRKNFIENGQSSRERKQIFATSHPKEHEEESNKNKSEKSGKGMLKRSSKEPFISKKQEDVREENGKEESFSTFSTKEIRKRKKQRQIRPEAKYNLYSMLDEPFERVKRSGCSALTFPSFECIASPDTYPWL